MAVQNAEIGVAKTAYYPNVLLSGAGGFDSGRFTTLLQGPAGFWSLAGSAAEVTPPPAPSHGPMTLAAVSCSKHVVLLL